MRNWFINVAISFNGMISKPSQAVNISNEDDWKIVHAFRNKIGGIVVGANTINVDDPSLMTRSEFLADNVAVQHPFRFILDRRGLVNRSSKVFQDQEFTKTFWYTQSGDDILNGTKVLIEEDDILWLKKSINAVLDDNQKSGDIMVEGGSNTIRRFVNSGLIDFIRVFRSSTIIADGLALFDREMDKELAIQSTRKLGNGMEEIYHII